MRIVDQENVSINGKTFNEEVFIRGGRNISFNDVIFNGGVKIYVDRDIESLWFGKSIFNTQIQVGYFDNNGILDGLNIDMCRFNQSRLQMFYTEFPAQKHRRTKHMVVKDSITSAPTEASYRLENCDNPIIENNTISGVGGVDNRNGLQVNGCLNPIIRKNTVINTVSTSAGDGSGIIIDWCVDKLTETEDAIIELNTCVGNRSTHNAAGIENYRGIRSVIRRNNCIDNNNGLRFVKYSDFHAYGNNLIENNNDVIFHECTSDGYEA